MPDSTAAPPGAERPGGGPRVAVLGGGVCGLYAALVLARHGVAVTVIESAANPGGLGAGHRRGANFYDFGVHMLHAFDAEVYADIGELLGDERVAVALDAKIRWADRYFRYPLQFGDLIRGIPTATLLRCVAGLLHQELRNRLTPVTPDNAEQALIQLYGKPLYDFFFREFTTRYWGTPPAQLSATFVRQKMPRLSAVDIVKNLLTRLGVKAQPNAATQLHTATQSALREETLQYSRTGAEAMPRHLVRRIEALGGQVILGHEVEHLAYDRAHPIQVSWRHRTTNESDRLTADYVISTIPIEVLLRTFRPSVPQPVVESATQLRYKAMVVFGLLVAKAKALDALYVYYRERIFHRVGEPKNAGMRVDPPGHTVLIVEMTCEQGDDKWNATPGVWEQLTRELALEQICRPEQIVERHVLRNAHAYPIFALGFERHLQHVAEYLDGVPGIVSVGRQGGFCYPNMHSAMRMGADAAHEALRCLKVADVPDD